MRKLSLALILVACGDDGVRHTSDAPRAADGATDSPVDAAVQPVTITAVRNGQPVSGVHVYFQNADSTVVLSTTTDANGTASAVMAGGGYVTAVNPYTLPALGRAADELDTFAGVKPGDHLVLTQSIGTTQATVSMVGPGEVGLSGYAAYSPCNHSGTQLQPPLGIVALAPGPVRGSMTLANCGSANDFLIVANGSAGLEWVYAADQAVADQGTVDMTALSYVAATSRSLSYTNIPLQQSLSFQDDVIDPKGTIFQIVNETPTGSAATSTYDVPLFAGAADVLLTFFNYTGTSQEMTVDWGMLGSATTIDMSTRVLYHPTGAPMFDPSTKAASIATDTTDGVAPDFEIFAINSSRAGRSWRWLVSAPFAASLPLPTVPTDVFDFNIDGSDSFGVNSWAAGKVPGGYDAIRPFVLSVQPYLNGLTVDGDAKNLAFGASGAASFVQWHPPLTIAPGSGNPAVLRHRTR